MNRNIIASAAALWIAVSSSGCMSMMLAGAPTTRSFEDPPVREIVDAYPRETLFGKWTATGKVDMFIDGKRVMVTDVADELVLNEDGTCTETVNQNIVENRLGGGFGYGMQRSQEMQQICEGTWTYESGILTMEMSTDVEGVVMGIPKKQTLEYTEISTLNWHSDEEFSPYETDEQAKANKHSFGSGLGWDSRTVEANGVQVFVKKGVPLMSPDQQVVFFKTPFKRAADGE